MGLSCRVPVLQLQPRGCSHAPRPIQKGAEPWVPKNPAAGSRFGHPRRTPRLPLSSGHPPKILQPPQRWDSAWHSPNCSAPGREVSSSSGSGFHRAPLQEALGFCSAAPTGMARASCAAESSCCSLPMAAAASSWERGKKHKPNRGENKRGMFADCLLRVVAVCCVSAVALATPGKRARLEHRGYQRPAAGSRAFVG